MDEKKLPDPSENGGNTGENTQNTTENTCNVPKYKDPVNSILKK